MLPAAVAALQAGRCLLVFGRAVLGHAQRVDSVALLICLNGAGQCCTILITTARLPVLCSAGRRAGCRGALRPPQNRPGLDLPDYPLRHRFYNLGPQANRCEGAVARSVVSQGESLAKMPRRQVRSGSVAVVLSVHRGQMTGSGGMALGGRTGGERVLGGRTGSSDNRYRMARTWECKKGRDVVLTDCKPLQSPRSAPTPSATRAAASSRS